MTTTLNYQLTSKTITVFIDGKLRQVARTPKSMEILREAQETGDLDTLKRLLDPTTGLNAEFDGTGIEIRKPSVLYRGKRIVGHLEARLLDIIDSGLDVNPWKVFVERIYANPSGIARDELALFFEGGSLPITPDGCFLAYKLVRDDYLDVHSGTFDNSVGQLVEMPRNEVDDDRNRTCSAGLHFCSKDYLPIFGGWNRASARRVMVLKIDPADVVSIPADYSNTKGRTWRYEVVGEIEFADDAERAEWGLPAVPVVSVYVGTFDFGTPDEVDVENVETDDFVATDDDDDEGDVTTVTSTTVPGERQSWWKRYVKR